jgi:hypothetical protein
MNLLVKVVVILAVVLIVAVAALRVRKLRRDKMRELSKPVERRLMTPPPSPYAPSKGFRLLDGPLDPTKRSEPPRPRLETDREYVFSETQMPTYDDVRPSPLRHNENWALSRSARHSSLPSTGLVVVAIALVAVLVVGFVGYYVQHGSPKANGPATSSTTTTTRASTTTTTLVWPTSFSPSSSSGQTATYQVPAVKYQVVVTGTRGASWAVYQMGAKNTLEWQGKVALGKSESLPMTGNSIITLGSPKSATVTVGGSPVVFPSPLPTTLNLSFVASPVRG